MYKIINPILILCATLLMALNFFITGWNAYLPNVISMYD